jgi:hypothetical protein
MLEVFSPPPHRLQLFVDQVKVKVILPWSVVPYVLMSGTHLGPMTTFLLPANSFRFVYVGLPLY